MVKYHHIRRYLCIDDEVMVRAFVEYVLGFFLNKKQRKKLSLKISFHKKLGDHYGVTIRRDENKYLVRIECRPRKAADSFARMEGVLGILAHELTHVKQYVRKELVDMDDESIKFLGKIYTGISHEKDGKPTDLYWYAPWEVEARGFQEGLIEMFRNHMELD